MIPYVLIGLVIVVGIVGAIIGIKNMFKNL